MVARLVAVTVTCIALAGCGGSDARDPPPRLLLPDLDQAAPQGVSVRQTAGRDLLTFLSAVDNLGDGAIVLVARRETTADPMIPVQVIEREDGSQMRHALDVELQYVSAEDHAHWHLVGFERYELRTVAGERIGRDRKTGFCLGDRYERTSIDLTRKPTRPVFSDECGKAEPQALHVREGISPGYGDPYVPGLEGQSIDVTSLAPGRYVLVHSVDPGAKLEEKRRDNNAAAALIDMRRRGGRLTARIVRSCPDTALCGD